MPLVTFGGYGLPGIITAISKPVAYKSRMADIAGADGSYSQGGLLSSKRITVKATWPRKGTGLTTNQMQDALNANLPGRRILPLVIEPGRYYPAHVEGITDTENNGYSSLKYEVAFVVPRGVALAAAETTTALSTSAQTSVVTAGGEDCLPRFVLTVGNLGTAGTVTITNTTTLQTITAQPSATGDLIIDSAAETFLRAGLDVTGEWLSGEWIYLAVGANALTISTTGGLTITAASVVYRNAWK